MGLSTDYLDYAIVMLFFMLLKKVKGQDHDFTQADYVAAQR
jgi:hypothetical protein